VRPLLEATADTFLSTAGATRRAPKIRVMTINRHRKFTELLVDTLEREPDLHSVGGADSAQAGVDLARGRSPMASGQRNIPTCAPPS